MPSIKAMLISVAVAALAFAPVDAATVSREAGIARRNAAARVLAKRAHSAKEFGGNYSSIDKLKISKAAARVRCGTDAVCEHRTAAPPANGAAVCLSGKCAYRCQSGFAPGGENNTECVASQSTCDGVECDVPENGYATCDATTGACNVGCNVGYTRFTTNSDPNQGPFSCFNIDSDPENCGFAGTACAASYNGIGTPACKSRQCKIQCPAGYFLRKAADARNPYYCYNGEGSLGTNVNY
ncbi:hypothetical protein JCM10213_007986 [Rhodosporidiobolus nylandii]